MNIAVDAGCLGVKDKRLKVGVYNFAKELLIHLSKTDQKNQYFLYSFHPIEKSLMKALGENMTNIVVRPQRGWLQIWVPIRMVRDRINLFLALGQAMPYRMPLGVKTIGLVYDIAFDKYPENYPDSYESLHNNTKHLVKKANHIIVSALATKQDLKKYYRVSENKISVIPMGARSFAKKKSAKPLTSNPYFLSVGALKRGKNVPTLIYAFDKFLQKSKKDVELLIVGGNKWLDPKIKKALEDVREETTERIQLVGFVEDIELAVLYRHAIAFVSPSFYEGFGLPFVEAMAQGCPVIGSDRGSVPEVVGKAGILLDPDDVDALSKAMYDIFSDHALRSSMIKKGHSQAHKFSWDTTAQEIQDIINQYHG